MQMPVVSLEAAVGPLHQRNRWYKQTWVREAESWRVAPTRRLISESHERHLSCKFTSNSSHNKVGPLLRDADLTTSTVAKIIRQNEQVINILVRSLFNLTLFRFIRFCLSKKRGDSSGLLDNDDWTPALYKQYRSLSFCCFFPYCSLFFLLILFALFTSSVSLPPCLVLQLLAGRWWVSGILLFTTEAPFMLYLLCKALKGLLN